MYINGSNLNFLSSETLTQVCARVGIDPTAKGIAIAVNEQIIPRHRWNEIYPEEEDRIEIIHAAQGG